MERLTFSDQHGWYAVDNSGERVRGSHVNRLAALEDILNGYDIDRLNELIEADREGRCVVLNTGYTETAGGKALKQAMYLCSVTNNEVTRYTADAIAEKLVREERFFEAVKERENDV